MLSAKTRYLKMKNNVTFNDIYKLINENHSFLITSHINPDGDAIGSELALYFILKKLNKEAIIINQDDLPKIYDFLPGSQYINNKNKNIEKVENTDIVIILDSSNINRIGDIQKLLYHQKIFINIDHHCSNDSYGEINYVDTKASSTGEIIFNFINYINPEILDETIAACLFVAIITDTGSFRYENTTEKTFMVVSKLLSTGIKPHIISQNIYNRKTFGELKLLGSALASLETDEANFASWVTIDRKMLKKTNTVDEDTEGIIDMVTTLKDSEVSILFRETDNGYTKVSLRSKGHFDVNQFASEFNGGGHPNAAGCFLKENLNNVKSEMLSALLKKK